MFSNQNEVKLVWVVGWEWEKGFGGYVGYWVKLFVFGKGRENNGEIFEESKFDVPGNFTALDCEFEVTPSPWTYGNTCSSNKT